MKTLTVRLEEELMKKVEEKSAAHDKTKSDFVREALIRQIENVQAEQKNIPKAVTSKVEFLLQILRCGEGNELNFRLMNQEVEKLWRMVKQS